MIGYKIHKQILFGVTDIKPSVSRLNILVYMSIMYVFVLFVILAALYYYYHLKKPFWSH